jgi:hypothetical protein
MGVSKSATGSVSTGQRLRAGRAFGEGAEEAGARHRPAAAGEAKHKKPAAAKKRKSGRRKGLVEKSAQRQDRLRLG